MTDLLTACFQATGATPEQAERAALAVREPDIITLLIDHQEAALVRLGCPLGEAHQEAVDVVSVFLEDAARRIVRDIRLGAALRQARVYRLRCQGSTFQVICERLGVSRVQADKDYRAELARRRTG